MDGYRPKNKVITNNLVPPAGGTGVQVPALNGVGLDIPMIRIAGAPERVYVRLSHKVNLGNYEMLEVTCGVDVAIEPGESIKAAFARVVPEVREELGIVREEVLRDVTKSDRRRRDDE